MAPRITIAEEEIERRRWVSAKMRQRAVQVFQEIEHQQQRLANAVHASLAEVRDSLRVDEAIRMLDFSLRPGKFRRNRAKKLKAIIGRHMVPEMSIEDARIWHRIN